MLENIELFGNSLGVGTYPDGEGKSFLQNIFDVIHPVGEVYIQYPAQKSPQEIYNKKDANNRIIIDSVWEEQLQYNSAFFRSEHLSGSYVYKVNNETQYYLIDNLNNLTPINITGNSGISIAGSPTAGQQKVIDGKTYQAYAVSGVNSSSNNYIKEGNNLSIQGNQNKYHRHSGTTEAENRGHVHYLSSSKGSIGGWVATTSLTSNTSLSQPSGAKNICHSSGDTSTGLGTGQKINSTSNPASLISASTTTTVDRESYSTGANQTHTHTFNTSYDGSSTDKESRPDNLTIKIWKRIS